MEAVIDTIFGVPKSLQMVIVAMTLKDICSLGKKAMTDLSHDIKRHLLLGRKDMTNLCAKKQRHHLPTKVHRVKAVVSSSSHV